MMEKDKNNSRKSNKLTDKHVAGKERRDKRKKKQRALLRWKDDNLHFATISLLKAFFNLTIYLGVNYGSHPWHWYFSNGLPCLLGPLLLLLLKVVIVCTYISGPVKKSDPTLNLNRTFSR